MTKLTLTQVNRYTKDKQGNPLKTKDGREYTRLVIKCNEYGDRPLSGFDSPQTSNFAPGATVEVEVEVKGEYLNFSVPKKEPNFDKLNALETRIARLVFLVTEIHDVIVKKETRVPYPTSTGQPDFDIDESRPDF